MVMVWATQMYVHNKWEPPTWAYVQTRHGHESYISILAIKLCYVSGYAPTRIGLGRIDSAPKGPTKAYNPLFLTRYSLVLLDRATFPLRSFCSSDRKQSSNIFTILKALPSHDTARSQNSHRVPPAHYKKIVTPWNVVQMFLDVCNARNRILRGSLEVTALLREHGPVGPTETTGCHVRGRGGRGYRQKCS